MSGVDFAAVDGDGKVNWKKAKAAGVDFAYLNATPGNSVWDQAEAANDAGVEVGPYVFPTVRKSELPALQMQRAWAAVTKQRYRAEDLIVCLDVELPKGIKGTGMQRSEVCDWFLAAYAELERLAGHSPLLYSSVRVLDTDDADTLNGGLNSLADRAPLGLARYDGQTATTAPKAWGAGNYWWHQLAGDRKGVGGIRQVDVDAWNYLRPGETGTRVNWLQKKLSVPITGRADDTTVAVLKGKQLVWNLDVDAIVGPRSFTRVAKL